MSKLQLLQLKDFVTTTSIKPNGGRLQGRDVQAYIEAEFNVKYQNTNVYHLLPGLNLSWISTQSKHPKQSVEAQEAFKKSLIKTILKIPGHLPLDRVDMWFQDEESFGQQNTTTRIWAEKGTRPRVVQQQQFTYAYLFGAVCVTNLMEILKRLLRH